MSATRSVQRQHIEVNQKWERTTTRLPIEWHQSKTNSLDAASC